MVLPRIASVVPTVLLTLAFAFAVVSTASPRWVTRTNLDDNDPPVNRGQLYRSPFRNCQSVFVNPTNGSAASFAVECVRHNQVGATCSSFEGDNPAFCQQLNLTAKLLIVGCVFAGLAFVLSWLLVGVKTFFPSRITASRHPQHSNGEGPYPSSLSPSLSYVTFALYIFSAVSAFSIAIAVLIGGNTLLNLQPPNGAFSNTAGSVDLHAGWTIDTGIAYANASWILGAFGAVLVDVVWGLPRGVAASAGYEPLNKKEGVVDEKES
jgi:hypothetical protein